MNTKFDIEGRDLVYLFSSEKFYVVPSYQRSYVWKPENVNKLLEDLLENFTDYENDQNDFFIGSIIIYEKESEINKKEYYIIDGQQRLTTLMLILINILNFGNSYYKESENIKDFVSNDVKNLISKITQVTPKEKKVEPKISFEIREEANEFIKSAIEYAIKGELESYLKLKEKEKINSESLSNIIDAINEIIKFLDNKNNENIIKNENSFFYFTKSILSQTFFALIESKTMLDAFKLFTIINNRGLKLTNAEILKVYNLEKIKDLQENKKYSKIWEQIENYFKDDMDLFLNYIRTIYLKDKAKSQLYNEFENKIFEIEKPLINPGIEFIEKMLHYKNIYEIYIGLKKDGEHLEFAYKNIIKIMKKTYKDKIWVPALLKFIDKFENEIKLNSKLLTTFIKMLDNYHSYRWLLGYSFTKKTVDISNILLLIENSNSPKEVLESNIWKSDFNIEELTQILKGDIYLKQYCNYLLFKYETILTDDDPMIETKEKITIEHILPQKPKTDSSWWEHFSEEEHKNYLHKIGNLTLITSIKNSDLGNKEYKDKIKKIKEFLGNQLNITTSFINQNILLFDKYEINNRTDLIVNALIENYKKY
ncbi:DUF262 domain-containing protein [Mycoplasmopsis adleri]|uniref:DUF262 domain-containing protein n=1 Tax=Mycoplasmopsis adleri TaxID=51362 RepID=UPI0038730D27